MHDRFYRNWISANSLAEMIGLGTSALLWIAVGPWLETHVGVVGMALAVVVGSTLIEGLSVGYGQWAVLRRRLPQISARAWIGATMLGALIAWTLGMVPSTIMNMSAEASADASAPEIAEWMVFVLAALMGLVLGPILGTPQWWVLRRWADKAIWWIPANAVAWAGGMVAIFAGMNFVPFDGPTWAIIASVLLVLAIAGAVVGAVHGLVLMRLTDKMRG